MNLLSRLLSLALSTLLILAPAGAQTAVQGLQIRAIQLPEQVTAGSLDKPGLTLELTDANGAPVSDAVVALRLPEEGPTGTLPDGSRGATVSTDASGRAQIPNIHWSTTPGVAIVRVTATKGIAHAGRLIEEHLTAARLATASPVASSLPSQPVPPGPSATPSRPVAPQISRNMRPAPAIAEPKVSIETDAPAPRTNISSRPTIAPPKDDLADPHVSITGASSLPQKSHGSGKAKWVILAIAIAGGAAGGGMVLMNNKAKTSVPAPAAGLTIGAPTISIGAPH